MIPAQSQIRTVQCYPVGSPFAEPVIELGSGQQLFFSFDDLSSETNSYTYKIVHCDPDWNNSNLSSFTYLTGFFSNPLDNYEYSFNTVVPYTRFTFLICDNMASIVMKNGWVQACFVGCDRVAANGDTANKIGTSGVAILARHYGIPFYVLGPTSTIDMACPDGDHIPIEQRDPQEIKTMWYEKPMALPEVKCYNPAFDVTDHELITAIVTEKGICYPSFAESFAKLFPGKGAKA